MSDNLAAQGNLVGLHPGFAPVLITSPQGPVGPPGPPGPSSTIFTYNFNSTITVPPAAGEVRLNNTDQTLATTMWVAYMTEPGNDAALYLKGATTANKIYLQDQDNSANYEKYQVTAAPVDHGTYTEIGVGWISGGSPVIRAGPTMPVIFLSLM